MNLPDGETMAPYRRQELLDEFYNVCETEPNPDYEEEIRKILSEEVMTD